MSKGKIVSKREVARLRKKFYSSSNIVHDRKTLLDQHYKVRTKHPVRRIIVFVIASFFAYVTFCLVVNEDYIWATVSCFISLFIYNISIFGAKSELDDCILETGELVVEKILEGIGDGL